MRWRTGFGWILLVSMLLAPLASAEAVSGAVVSRSLRVETPSVGTFDPLALFLPDASRLSLFEVRAPLLHIERHELRMQMVDVLGIKNNRVTGRDNVTYDMRNALANASGSPGWLGIATPGGELAARAAAPLAIEASGDETIGQQDFGGGGNEFASFQAPVAGPHLRATLAGAMSYHGPVRIYVMGLDLDISSDHNETREPTGVEEESAPVGERVERWVVLWADSADVLFDTSLPFDLAAARGTVAWDGEAYLAPVDGRLEAGSSTYAATSGVQTLAGDLRAMLSPRDARLLDVALEGDLSSTTFVRMPVPRESDMALPSGALWVALGLGVAVGGGGLAFNAWSRRRPPASFGAEQAAELADLAIAEGRFDEALAWLRHARTVAPSSRRLLLDEAYCLGALGRQPEALALYDSAGEDPDAQFRAGLLLARDPARIEESEGRLVRALSLQPALAADVPPDLAPEMAERPAFQRALADARRAMEDESQP